MLSKLTTALFVGLAASAALNLNPRQDDGDKLVCFGSCGDELWVCPVLPNSAKPQCHPYAGACWSPCYDGQACI